MGYLYLRPKLGFDWSKIDKVDLAIDAFAILGDVVKGAGPPGMLTYGVSEVVELADAVGKMKAIYDIGTGDWSSLLFEGLELLGKETPNFGAYVNVTSIVGNLKNGFFIYYEQDYYFVPAP